MDGFKKHMIHPRLPQLSEVHLEYAQKHFNKISGKEINGDIVFNISSHKSLVSTGYESQRWCDMSDIAYKEGVLFCRHHNSEWKV